MARALPSDGFEEQPRRPDDRRADAPRTADFLQAVGFQMGLGPLTAGALARAAAQVLPVDGVGLSLLVDELRLPLGASTAAAEQAEELQTTLGDGPCLDAARTKTGYQADLDELRNRWPLYAEELTRRTPYRSAASIPVRTPDGHVFAAMDFYAEVPQLRGLLDLDEVEREIGAPLGALLDVCMHPVRIAGTDAVLPEWYVDATERRQDVWIATGMVMGREHQASDDALSLLRGFAYSHDRSLDDVAGDIVQGVLRVRDIAE